jgi:hypothetical protein
MDKVAGLTDVERSDLFQSTAEQTGLPPAVVEKDFWVCWTLKRIYESAPLRNAQVFNTTAPLGFVARAFGVAFRKEKRSGWAAGGSTEPSRPGRELRRRGNAAPDGRSRSQGAL